MFPHMYKVRPPRPGRRGEGPSSGESEWQGDTRRRNSNTRRNPNWEGPAPPTPTTPTPATPLPTPSPLPAAPPPIASPFAAPPPIPAPPPEAQDSLNKMTSPAARLDGVDATNQAAPSPVPWWYTDDDSLNTSPASTSSSSPIPWWQNEGEEGEEACTNNQDDTANFNASPVPWRRDRSRTSSPATAPKQNTVRKRERQVPVQDQESDAQNSSPAAARKQSRVRSRERQVPVQGPQETDTQVMPSATPPSLPVPVPVPEKENISRETSPAVKRLRQEDRSRTSSPKRPSTPREQPGSRTFTPPVPLEAVVIDPTSPEPKTFTTTVPIVIERHPQQDQKNETLHSASPLPAHQLQQKQQRQKTPVQQLQAEDQQQQQQQQQQRRRQRSPASPPEEWGTPQEHLDSSLAFLACRSRTPSPPAPPQELQQEQQLVPQQAAVELKSRTPSPPAPPLQQVQQEQQQLVPQQAAVELISRDSREASPAGVFQMDSDIPDSREASPAGVFQMDSDIPAVEKAPKPAEQVPPMEMTPPPEKDTMVEDTMLLKESDPLECFAPMDLPPMGSNDFQDLMSALGMDNDSMDEFRKALDITNDTQPPKETSEPSADNASDTDGKQPPQGSELAKVFADRKATADRRLVEPEVQKIADLSPTTSKFPLFPELRKTPASLKSSHLKERPEDSMPVLTPSPPPSSQPLDIPQSHERSGSPTEESSTPVTSSGQTAEMKKDRTRAASPEPTVIAPPPPPPPKSIPPPPPEMPGKSGPAPPPPPMPGLPGCEIPKLRPMTARKRKTLDSIKKAARSRPDWYSVMKNIEGGVQLRRVDASLKSDRSQPIMPSSRGRNGKFVYESEKPNLHNELLNQIQRGVRLRKTRTNDRSSVDFKSLGQRKFRRQVTVEEQEKEKEEKKDTKETIPSSSDEEEEDIDKMRDDLEATKAQITEEIKNRRKVERENKIMKIDIDSLNAQIKKLKRQLKEAGVSNGPMAADDEIIPKLEKSMSRLRMREEEDDFSELDTLETEINNLKTQADAHKKVAEDWERKFHDVQQKLQVSESSADEWESRSIYFEKKFKGLQKEHNIELPDIGCVGTQTDPAEFPCPTPVAPPVLNEDLYAIPKKSSSRRSFSSQFSRMESFREVDSEDSDRSESEEEEEEEEEEEDMGAEADMEEEDEGDDEAAVARRAENEAKRKDRDLKLWKNKLAHMKEKEANVQRERNNLRERIKKYFRDMKTERQEYLKVKSEMDELAGVVIKEPSEDEEESEESEEELPPEAEDGSCWFDEPAPRPKKLKKRKKKKKLNADGEEIEDEDEEEDLEDLSLLEEPNWTDSEYSQSETDNEDEDFNSRLSRLSTRTHNHEQHMNKMKKDNYLLKGQVERADEMYLVERRRHQRQDEELHMILAEM